MRLRLRVMYIGISVSLLVALLSLLNVHNVAAQTVLPACSAEILVEHVRPSPRFDQDATIFWIHRRSLLRSRDFGQTWQQVFQTTPDPDAILIQQFEMVSEGSALDLRVFMGVHDASFSHYHFYYSDDGGDTWQERTPACSASPWNDCGSFSLRAAGQAPVLFQPRLWYFGWSPLPFGISRSQDGGLTWQMVWEETDALAVAVSPNYDADQTLWAMLRGYSPTLGDDFILSHDGGETWQAAGQGLCDVAMDFADIQVSPDYARDHTLLIGLYQNSLFRSRDGGLTWHAIFPRGSTAVCDFSLTELGDLSPRFAPNYPDDPTIYVGTNQGLYVSYDDGQSWRRLTVIGNLFSLEVAGQAGPPTVDQPTRDQPALSWVSAGDASGAALHQVFLPHAAVQGASIPTRPYSLFMHAYVVGTYDAYMYRSDDGGATWQCMERPQVRRRAFLPLL